MITMFRAVLLHQVRLQHRQAKVTGRRSTPTPSRLQHRRPSRQLLPPLQATTRCATPRVNFQEPIPGGMTTPWWSQPHQAARLGLLQPKPRQGLLNTASGLPGAATLGVRRNNRANRDRILADTQCRTFTYLYESWYEFGQSACAGNNASSRSTCAGWCLRRF